MEEGDKVVYSASFTRPDELWGYEYSWNFGDGSPTQHGEPEEGASRIETTHAFANHRPAAYPVVLTVSAMSEAGQVSASDSFSVQVTESESLVVGNWNIGGTVKEAVRTLSIVTRGGDNGTHLACDSRRPGALSSGRDHLPRQSERCCQKCLSQPVERCEEGSQQRQNAAVMAAGEGVTNRCGAVCLNPRAAGVQSTE